MKTLFILLVVIPLSFPLLSQENKMTKMEIPEKWAVDFDKHKLERFHSADFSARIKILKKHKPLLFAFSSLFLMSS
ncbi:MAG: hypothetical protein DRI87_07885 [Bacteroidetes bacterium]|nr:MAG: hypothetical protein DRI87_07885 [Bacteroidota bacterium]